MSGISPIVGVGVLTASFWLISAIICSLALYRLHLRADISSLEKWLLPVKRLLAVFFLVWSLCALCLDVWWMGGRVESSSPLMIHLVAVDGVCRPACYLLIGAFLYMSPTDLIRFNFLQRDWEREERRKERRRKRRERLMARLEENSNSGMAATTTIQDDDDAVDGVAMRSRNNNDKRRNTRRRISNTNDSSDGNLNEDDDANEDGEHSSAADENEDDNNNEDEQEASSSSRHGSGNNNSSSRGANRRQTSTSSFDVGGAAAFSGRAADAFAEQHDNNNNNNSAPAVAATAIVVSAASNNYDRYHHQRQLSNTSTNSGVITPAGAAAAAAPPAAGGISDAGDISHASRTTDSAGGDGNQSTVSSARSSRTAGRGPNPFINVVFTNRETAGLDVRALFVAAWSHFIVGKVLYCLFAVNFVILAVSAIVDAASDAGTRPTHNCSHSLLNAASVCRMFLDESPEHPAWILESPVVFDGSSWVLGICFCGIWWYLGALRKQAKNNGAAAARWDSAYLFIGGCVSVRALMATMHNLNSFRRAAGSYLALRAVVSILDACFVAAVVLHVARFRREKPRETGQLDVFASFFQ